MKPKILLVNPPIYDFAAYDFWLKPYGMLCVGGLLRSVGNLSLFDYMDRLHPAFDAAANAKTDIFSKGPYPSERIPKPISLKDIQRYYRRFGMPRQIFRDFLSKNGPYDAVLTQTVMTYWYPGVAEVIEDVRQHCPGAKIVLGGFYATVCTDHAKDLGADAVITGDNLEPLWQLIGQKPPKQFHPPVWELYPKLETGVMTLTRGCPFKCEFCLSSLDKTAMPFALEPFLKEMDKLHQRGARNFKFIDRTFNLKLSTSITILEFFLQRMSDDIIEGLNDLIDKAIVGTYPPKKKKKKKKGEKGPVEYVEAPEEGKTYLRLGREDIEDITIGFNTAMHHILLNLNPEFVGLAPFPPVIHHSMDIKARDIGINVNPSTYLFVLPIEAGFVGADNVGVLLAEEPYKHDENQLIIDIGTNGELVLGNRHKLISSSCATGPALEGAQLAFGMRAAPGAIERIAIDPETKEVDYKVIGRDAWRKFSEPKDMKAKGICGSGAINILAEFLETGVLDQNGKFNRTCSTKRIREGQDGFELLTGDINEDCIVNLGDLAIMASQWFMTK